MQKGDNSVILNFGFAPENLAYLSAGTQQEVYQSMLVLGFFSPMGWEGSTRDSLVPGFPSSSQISSRHSSLSFGTGMDFQFFSESCKI